MSDEKRVLGEGPLDAKIMIVGEAPGEREVELGRPFVGTSGRLLDAMLEEAGIKRAECYITNVMEVRPDGNDFGKFYDDKARRYPSVQLQLGQERVNSDIRRIRPSIIITLGEEATYCTTLQRGIGNWRGSIIEGTAGVKVCPTYHPAAILRDWKLRTPALCDLRRAAGNALFAGIRTTGRTLVVPNSGRECRRELELILKESTYVSFDIETESDQITCIGLSPSHRPGWAVCIPFWFGSSGSLFGPDDEREIWNLLRDILQSEQIRKVAHNGMYDVEFIQRTMGFDTRGLVFDTMLAFHTLYAELPKSLAFVTSLYTDHPYYKYQLKTPSMDEYFRYCATDACLTMEIALKLERELVEEGLKTLYDSTVNSLVSPLLAMQQKGVKFDYLKRNSLKKRVQEEIAVLQRNINKSTGRELNTNSPKQMKEWLYASKEDGGLGCKERTKKRKGQEEATISADEEALLDCYEETKNEDLKRVIEIREGNKLLSTYIDVRLDADKRIRCSYLISGTETGRLSSRTTLRGTGTNLQNIPNGGDAGSRWSKTAREIKSLFIPDEGYIFINADLSQAEARVVAYLSGDRSFIGVFESGGDIHRRNAANIFKVSIDAVTDEQRQLAKRVVHASNYGMGPLTFARTTGLTVVESRRLLDQYFATYPGVRNWQLSVAAGLKKSRYITTPLGRRRLFLERWGEGLIKEALAYVPQSTVADVVNRGLRTLFAKNAGIAGYDILLQVHDSILIQCPIGQETQAAQALREALTIPITINGRHLVIPVDIKIGPNWNDLKKMESS